MFNNQNLYEFLVKSKRATYASGDTTKNINEADRSTTLVFEENDWKYQDNYFGGEPFGGREVVFFKNQPVYIMTYYGWVEKDVEDIAGVYKTLQDALKLIPENAPYRGPEEYRSGDFVYQNKWQGEVDNFSGEEKILYNGQMVYTAKYMGGLVDVRKE